MTRYFLIFILVISSLMGLSSSFTTFAANVAANDITHQGNKKEIDETLIGKWRSEALRDNWSTLMIYLVFSDDGFMSLEYVTEYEIYEVEKDVKSSILVTGTYSALKGTLYFDFDEQALTEISDMIISKSAAGDKKTIGQQLNAKVNDDMREKFNYIYDNLDRHDIDYTVSDDDDRLTLDIYDKSEHRTINFRRVY